MVFGILRLRKLIMNTINSVIIRLYMANLMGKTKATITTKKMDIMDLPILSLTLSLFRLNSKIAMLVGPNIIGF